jgi:hypothetical protein
MPWEREQSKCFVDYQNCSAAKALGRQKASLELVINVIPQSEWNIVKIILKFLAKRSVLLAWSLRSQFIACKSKFEAQASVGNPMPRIGRSPKKPDQIQFPRGRKTDKTASQVRDSDNKSMLSSGKVGKTRCPNGDAYGCVLIVLLYFKSK